MIQKICDKCKKNIERDFIQFNLDEYKDGERVIDRMLIDLCPDCGKQFKALLGLTEQSPK